LGYDSVVLIASVDVCANASIVDLGDKPFMGLFGVWLFLSSPMRKLRSVDACQPYVKLFGSATT
jgi:hypothetical protein